MKIGMQTMRPLALSAIMFTMLFTGGVLSPWAATAATYYVATNGNNANPGTLALPFSTAAKAMSVMGAGDTVYLRGGTYNQSILGHLIPVPSGTSWTNAVTIASYPGETATFRPSGVREIMNFHTHTYIILDRLVLDAINVQHGTCRGDGGAGNNCYGNVLSAGTSGGHHLRITNSELKNGYGTNVDGPGHSSEILNSKIYGSRWGYGLYMQQHSVRIENCEIYDNGGYGIHSYTATASNVNNMIFRNNRLWGNGYVRGEAAVIVSKGSNSQVYNNLIYNNHGGIQVFYSVTNALVYNNTIYNNSPGAAIGVQGATNPVIRNNIMYQNAGNLVQFGTNPGAVISNNLTTNPQFTNAATNDFRLQPGSPAIDAGVDISVVAVDFDGMTRPQGSRFDIGAYEYHTASSFPTPTNLRHISTTP